MTTHPMEDNQSDFEAILEESVHLLDMPDAELALKMEELDQEISMMERAHDLEATHPDLSEAEQRRLNWMLNWENFARNLQKTCDTQAERFKKESDALCYLSLADLYRRCEDDANAEAYAEKAFALARDLGYQYHQPESDINDVMPFRHEALINEFLLGWQAAAKQSQATPEAG